MGLHHAFLNHELHCCPPLGYNPYHIATAPRQNWDRPMVKLCWHQINEDDTSWLSSRSTIHTKVCFYQESIEDNNINVDVTNLALIPPHLRITPDHLVRSFVFPYAWCDAFDVFAVRKTAMISWRSGWPVDQAALGGRTGERGEPDYSSWSGGDPGMVI